MLGVDARWVPFSHSPLCSLLALCVFVSLVTQSLNPWSLAHRLSNISWLILMEVKLKAWKSILTSTASGQSVNITINRPRALKARERGNDPDGVKCLESGTMVSRADGPPIRDARHVAPWTARSRSPSRSRDSCPRRDTSYFDDYTVTPEHRLTVRWNGGPSIAIVSVPLTGVPTRVLVVATWWDRETLKRRSCRWQVSPMSASAIDRALPSTDSAHPSTSATSSPVPQAAAASSSPPHPSPKKHGRRPRIVDGTQTLKPTETVCDQPDCNIIHNSRATHYTTYHPSLAALAVGAPGIRRAASSSPSASLAAR
jgi:hypothetical protein